MSPSLTLPTLPSVVEEGEHQMSTDTSFIHIMGEFETATLDEALNIVKKSACIFQA